MKLDLYEKMEILQNCNLKNIESIDDSRLYDDINADVIKNCESILINRPPKNDLTMQNTIEKGNEFGHNEPLEEPNLTDLQPLIQPPLEPDKSFPLVETVTLTEDFLSSNIQNMINLPENQIVKIQYQNENGVVNTQYIVNQELLNVELNINTNYVDINQEINESLYEEQVPYKIIVENPEIATHNDEEILGMASDINHFDLQREICIQSHPGGADDDVSVSNINCPEAEMKTSLLSPQSEEESVTETDLTSLNWLHNITNIMSVPNLPTPPVSPKPKRRSQTNNNQEDLTININFYKKNGDKKPPFSYATLICMAMGKNGNKMTLSAIYHWIRENFLYYRKAHPSWQVK